MSGSPLGERVYAQLRDELLGGRRAVTDRLTEHKLATELGVSRTPVREALTRLVADGLVRRADYGYAIVLPNPATVRELFEVTVALELYGIARCVENPALRHDPALVAAELARWRELRTASPLPPAEFVLQDERFHTTLLAASGNPELVSTLESVNRRIRHARTYYSGLDDHIERATTEHIQIAEHVLAHRLDAALALLRRHLTRS